MKISVECGNCGDACGSYDPGRSSGPVESSYPAEWIKEPEEYDSETDHSYCSKQCRDEYELLHMSEEAYADKMFPAGCQCTETNGGGDCDWCRAYYLAPKERTL